MPKGLRRASALPIGGGSQRRRWLWWAHHAVGSLQARAGWHTLTSKHSCDARLLSPLPVFWLLRAVFGAKFTFHSENQKAQNGF